jgi:hypothetical protein
MKRLLTLIALAALFLGAVSTQAQVPTYGSQTLWTTNGAGIPAATAVAGNVVIDCRKQNTFALQITAQSDTGGGAISLTLTPSVDGVTFANATTPYGAKTVGFTPAVTATTLFTNINTYGAGYYKLSYVTNDTGAACTNLSIKYGVKISAP